jgi:hypothetical protein
MLRIDAFKLDAESLPVSDVTGGLRENAQLALKLDLSGRARTFTKMAR